MLKRLLTVMDLWRRVRGYVGAPPELVAPFIRERYDGAVQGLIIS
jgi:hypothetical protein